MEYQYIWKIVDLVTQASINNLQNVITQCEWSLMVQKIEKEDEMNQSSWVHHLNGVQELPSPEGQNFISYDELTEDQILQWLWNGLIDKDEVESQAKQKLDECLSSNNELALPWAHLAAQAAEMGGE